MIEQNELWTLESGDLGSITYPFSKPQHPNGENEVCFTALICTVNT